MYGLYFAHRDPGAQLACHMSLAAYCAAGGHLLAASALGPVLVRGDDSFTHALHHHPVIQAAAEAQQ